MRLINYGVGEIVDRLTILDLKIQHGTEVDHFRNERSALLAKAAPSSTQAWFPFALKLAMINGLLWQAEDAIRSWRATQRSVGTLDARSLAEVGGMAFRIQELNDVRATLIQEINKLTGEHLGAEKVNA